MDSPVFMRLKSVYHEYPSQFWTLTGASFIDMLGSALLYPFFTLYITRKFNVGMTQVGLIFGVMSIFAMGGTAIGGALADRFGRKKLMLLGLVASGLSSLLLGLINRFEYVFFIAALVGLVGNMGGPARGAMIADILPEEKRAQGFGMYRVVFNLAVTIGPAIGGLLAARSYFSLFVIDAVASVITAGALYAFIRETNPEASESQKTESTIEAFGGYGRVLRDRTFMIFLLATALLVLVMIQMNGTLAVYLRDVHGVLEQQFGFILTMNAGMVVLLQFAVTRWIEGLPRFRILAVGALLYAVGMSMYGYVAVYGLFFLAMVIITMGEMLIAPVGQAVATSLAPEDMRGRYMAVYGLSWAVPNAVGFTLAGLIMDHFDPRWVWYAAGIVGLIACLFFFSMHVQAKVKPPSRARPAKVGAGEVISG
jgi:MFS family permease